MKSNTRRWARFATAAAFVLLLGQGLWAQLDPLIGLKTVPPNVAVASEAACISAVNAVRLINSFEGSVGVSVSSTNPDRVAPVRMSFQFGVIRMSARTRSTAASAAYSVWLPAR